MERTETTLALSPTELAARIDALADDWGGRWEGDATGGTLEIPVVFGLRRGALAGRVDIEANGKAGSRVIWRLIESRLEVHRAAVAVLSFAAVPSLALLAWPFWPGLLALAPLALVLGFLAWWLVVSRLRSSGPEEFLAALSEPAGPDPLPSS